MPFSDAIKLKAMLACGRKCCICHKFCGNNMEVHHIKAHANGGTDTFKNAIPLCFDCHAIVRQYDPKHPKGIKFSEQELIGHRDTWYQRIRDGETTAEKKADTGAPLIKPMKILRQKSSEELRLVRITTGRELLAYASNVCAMEYDYDDSANKSEISQIADFMQEISNLIDFSDDMQPQGRINMAAEFSDQIASLEKIGYWVFAMLENRIITGGVLPDDNFPVLLIRVIKSTNPAIEKL